MSPLRQWPKFSVVVKVCSEGSFGAIGSPIRLFAYYADPRARAGRERNVAAEEGGEGVRCVVSLFFFFLLRTYFSPPVSPDRGLHVDDSAPASVSPRGGIGE